MRRSVDRKGKGPGHCDAQRDSGEDRKKVGGEKGEIRFERGSQTYRKLHQNVPRSRREKSREVERRSRDNAGLHP